MGSVRSHKFCCCIPVRFGVFILSTLCFVGGSIVAAVGWHAVTQKEQSNLTKRQEISLVITSISYTVLAIVSVFGLIGTFIKRRSFVSWYSTVMAWHLGFSIASGAYFIFTLFRKAGENEVDKCIANNGGDSNKEEDCRRALKLGRGIVIALYVLFWLFELWVCVIISDYVSQLDEEEALDNPPPVQISATAPMATTYNYGAQYAFSQPGNAYGQLNSTAV